MVYLYDTGEVLVGKTKYADIQTKQADFSVTYVKNDFEKGDIRPEMYFECTAYDSVNNKTTKYADPSNQEIQYEINYSKYTGKGCDKHGYLQNGRLYSQDGKICR